MSTLASDSVAILFSGGDSPGMNACLRAVTRFGLNVHHTPVIGVRHGYKGLVHAAQSVAARFADCAWQAIKAGMKCGVTALRQSRVELVPFDTEPVPGRAEKAAEFHRIHAALSQW